MPALQFNSVGIDGVLQELVWDDVTLTAYVISQNPILSGIDTIADFYISTVQFISGAPVLLGTVQFVGCSTTPSTPGNLHPSRSQFFGTARDGFSPFPNSCVDASGRFWSAWQGGAEPNGSGIPPSVDIAFLFTTDPATGISTQQLSSFTGDLVHQLQTRPRPGLYSFMAGGVNYLWSSIQIEFARPTTTSDFVMIIDPSAPSYNASGPQLDELREYSAPIFDGIQFAYLIESQEQDPDFEVIPDDGSFTLIKYSVLGGVASEAARYALRNARSIGRAFWGIYNPLTNTILLFTTGGALQVFDPAMGTVVSTIDGVFAGFTLDGFSGFFPEIFNLIPQYGATSPPTIAAAQLGKGDVLNCTMMGLSPVGSLVENLLTRNGIRRLNLSDLSVLDDRYPQNEWLFGTASPAGMMGNIAQHAPGINSLLWLSGKSNQDPSVRHGNQLLQLKWPSQGVGCAAAPLVARQPNTFVIS
jgi:hypothetical protein